MHRKYTFQINVISMWHLRLFQDLYEPLIYDPSVCSSQCVYKQPALSITPICCPKVQVRPVSGGDTPPPGTRTWRCTSGPRGASHSRSPSLRCQCCIMLGDTTRSVEQPGPSRPLYHPTVDHAGTVTTSQQQLCSLTPTLPTSMLSWITTLQTSNTPQGGLILRNIRK